MVQFVKNQHLKVSKTWPWVLPFWVWHSMSVTHQEQGWYAWQKCTLCHEPPFSAFHWQRMNQHGCMLRSSNLKQKKKQNQKSTFVALLSVAQPYKACRWKCVAIFYFLANCCHSFWSPLMFSTCWAQSLVLRLKKKKRRESEGTSKLWVMGVCELKLCTAAWKRPGKIL